MAAPFWSESGQSDVEVPPALSRARGFRTASVGRNQCGLLGYTRSKILSPEVLLEDEHAARTPC
jgi:hypothetical protein